MFSWFNSNSEVNASELPENNENMLHRYYLYGAVSGMFKSSTSVCEPSRKGETITHKKEHTLFAHVSCSKVRRESIRTSCLAVKGLIWYRYGTSLSPATAMVSLGKDVLLASNIPEITHDTSSQTHPTIPGRCHHNDLIASAWCVERLKTTEVLDF